MILSFRVIVSRLGSYVCSRYLCVMCSITFLHLLLDVFYVTYCCLMEKTLKLNSLSILLRTAGQIWLCIMCCFVYSLR